MRPEDLHLADDRDMVGSVAAMKRAAKMARQVAIETNKAIVVMRDNKIVRITAKQLRREMARQL
jgi:hypothetical protein